MLNFMKTSHAKVVASVHGKDICRAICLHPDSANVTIIS